MNRIIMPSVLACTAILAAAQAAEASCSVSASAVSFGTFGLIGNPIDSTGDLSVTCSLATSYTVGLDGGQAGQPASRLLSSGSATIAYGLYKDSARSELWGDTGSDTQSGTGTGSAQTYTIYGRIPTQSTPAPGSYTDTIFVTVTY